MFLLKDGVQSLLMDTTISVSSFGEDDTGEIYVLGLAGTIYKVVNSSVRPVTSVSAANYRGGTVAADSIVAAFGTQLATSRDRCESLM